MIISPAHNIARLAGTLAHADTGIGNSKLYFYATTQPGGGADPGGDPLVVVILGKPCGVISNGVLTLSQADPSGDLITNGGAALWARHVNGNGDWMTDGSVSDSAGTGDFKLSGTTGTMLYAGGRALIGVCTLA
ncbi:MAG: hypothetical protein FD135_2626 [Comamonadaceae bacterium]|nr:MAG: hypothetical protein FD135_2626 [Comamonadaceae bacterium]